MTFYRREFLYLSSAGTIGLPTRDADRESTSLSVAAGAPARRLWRRRRRPTFCHWPADGTIAVRSARPAVRRREQGRRAAAAALPPRRSSRQPADGQTLLGWSSLANAVECDALNRQADLQFHPRHRADGRRHQSRAPPTSWSWCRRFRPKRSRSSSPMPRPIRARSTWRRPASARRRTWPASCFKVHDRRRHGACRLSRLRHRHWPTCWPDRCRSILLRFPLRSGMSCGRAVRLRALGGDDGGARMPELPDVPGRGGVRAGLPIRAPSTASARPRNTPADIVDRLNKEIDAEPRRCHAEGSGLPTSGAPCHFHGSPADFAKLVADETEKWAKVIP